MEETEDGEQSPMHCEIVKNGLDKTAKKESSYRSHLIQRSPVGSKGCADKNNKRCDETCLLSHPMWLDSYAVPHIHLSLMLRKPE